MMQQYLKIHEEVPECLMFFRLGDFYEMFFDDALNAAKALDLVLTGRDCGLDEKAPMCGVPAQAVDSYVARLVEKGFKVAICEQMSDPRLTKGLVEREIVRVISSGTLLEGRERGEKGNNYIACLYYNKSECGAAWVDVATGEAHASDILLDGLNRSTLSDFVSMAKPAEILTNPVLYAEPSLKSSIEAVAGFSCSLLDSGYFALDRCTYALTEQLGSYSLTGTGLEGKEVLIKACGALFRYLKETQKVALSHISRIRLQASGRSMALDHATKRNLELTETIFTKQRKGSLLWVLDHTSGSQGARSLQKWVAQPLLNMEEIEDRHEAVGELIENAPLIAEVGKLISKMSDIQRLCSRIAYRTANGRDLLGLVETSRLIDALKAVCAGMSSSLIARECLSCDSLADIASILEGAIDPQCSAQIGDGTLIRTGFDETLDGLKKLKGGATSYLMQIEAEEREKSGIKNLKVKYNRVFGYYFEVTKSNLANVPQHFIRKQTLANAERFYTQELKELEDRLLSSQDEIAAREAELFGSLLETLNESLERIFEAGERIGNMDAINSLAHAAFEYGYVRPKLNAHGVLRIVDGRHPVVERLIEKKSFIGNDVYLDSSADRMLIITGPNMAGKSTFIRQTAIICLMSQIGSFVPAQEADLCILDRIFTRVGASDDLVGGQSTFMVEMSEVSNILRNATSQSLIVLDEVGRGTSTFDGMSIARSILEYIADKGKIGAKCLFATHYHELTELEKEVDGVKNYSITVSQSLSGLKFSHRIAPGPADKSYGIVVAKLAGLPEEVVTRAEEILAAIENAQAKKPRRKKSALPPELDANSLINYRSSIVLDEIKSLPLYEMTPIEVMSFVGRLKKELEQ
jgi:DNA mismatch repair protein MutS